MFPSWQWSGMTNPGFQHPGFGSDPHGYDPQLQSQQQQQAQFQIDVLRHQNSLLNQQLATQAASHIQHLQQTLQTQPQSNMSQPPPVVNPSYSPHPIPPTSSHSTTAATAADAQPSGSKDTSSPPTTELLKKMGDELKETLESSVRDRHHEPPLPPPHSTPVTTPTPPISTPPPVVPAPQPMHPPPSPLTPSFPLHGQAPQAQGLQNTDTSTFYSSSATLTAPDLNPIPRHEQPAAPASLPRTRQTLPRQRHHSRRRHTSRSSRSRSVHPDKRAVTTFRSPPRRKGHPSCHRRPARHTPSASRPRRASSSTVRLYDPIHVVPPLYNYRHDHSHTTSTPPPQTWYSSDTSWHRDLSYSQDIKLGHVGEMGAISIWPPSRQSLSPDLRLAILRI